MIDIKQALKEAIQLLSETSPSATIDAEVLLAHTLGKTRAFLYAHPEELLNEDQWHGYQQLFKKRHQGYPIAYLIGSKEFWSLPLRTNEETLIPRPETELLVELTLALLKDKEQAFILELGTGTGAIALALASERPNWQILACDISQSALKIANDNKQQFGLSNLRFCHSDWFSAITEQIFDAIISNPPYIAEGDPHLNQGDIRFEPRGALVSGATGLEALTTIIQTSYPRLAPGGLLLVEHGFEQKQAVAALFKQAGYQNIHCWQDWQGNDRVSGGWRCKDNFYEL